MRIAELSERWPDLESHEIERLAAKTLGVGRAELIGVDLSQDQVAAFADLARRRMQGEPLQYLEETVQFGPIELLTDHRALIPRPETEQLWERVVAAVHDPGVVVDLCTGSGNMALACKWQWPAARVLASDLSSDAISLAQENADHTGLAIEILQGDLYAPLPHTIRGMVDVIVANPPYLAADELGALPAEVRDHEPGMALVAGEAGDEVLARIAREAPRWLARNGLIACEISEFRTDRVEELFSDLDGVVHNDLTGRPRFVIGHNTMPDSHSVAREMLQTGGVIGVPTDTVYGIAADVYSAQGVGAIYALKRRSPDKPLPVLAATIDQVAEVAVLDDRTRSIVEERWPGNVTYVVPRRNSLPPWVGDAATGTIGVRIPDHDELIRLMRRTGPLAATSANISDQPEVLDDEEAAELFGDDLVYVPGRARGGRPSAVIDLTGPEPRTLRSG